MGRKKRNKFTNTWGNQTDIGRAFGMSAIALGKRLKELGLKGADNKPTEKALEEGYAKATPLKDGTEFYMWNKQKVKTLLTCEAGLKTMSGQEIKARKLAEEYIKCDKNCQKAITGMEEEMYYLEAQEIRREAKKVGIELVNRFLKELGSFLRIEADC